jgi:hypothetical protein
MEFIVCRLTDVLKRPSLRPSLGPVSQLRHHGVPQPFRVLMQRRFQLSKNTRQLQSLRAERAPAQISDSVLQTPGRNIVRRLQVLRCVRPSSILCATPAVHARLSGPDKQQLHFIHRHHYYCGAPCPVIFPITSPETIISTRRFNCRPSDVPLSATGSALPMPRATTLFIFTPELTR